MEEGDVMLREVEKKNSSWCDSVNTITARDSHLL